jgi:thioredoxin 1
MKVNNLKFPILFFLVAFAFSTYAQKNDTIVKEKNPISYKVTFVELGSVRCIPCQQMQAVIKSIEQKFPTQVKVIFYDVWTAEGKPFAKKYAINLIPTQIFLDDKGVEYFRHEGYFSEEEVLKVLKKKGVEFSNN